MTAIRNQIRKHKVSRLIVLLFLTAAACLLVYSPFADAVSDIRQLIVISGYDSGAGNLSEEEIFGLREAALDYNRLIWIGQQAKPFRYEGEKYKDPLYDSILRVSGLSSVMAYTEIPKTGAYVPVVHGTRAEDLAYQAGHMRGTSVPIGGENSHSVISAHTGLRNARLFTGIDRLVPGDQVYIHVLGEIHVYTVRRTETVLPKKADAYLQIEEGRDLLTLYTCTPYGINSHRLLVLCERTGDLDPASRSGWADSDHRSLSALIRAVLWALIPAGILAAGLILILTKRGRHMIDKLMKVRTGEFPDLPFGWLLLLFASLMLLVPAKTAAAEAPHAVIDEMRRGRIELDYQDDLEGDVPIEGAGFTAYRIAGITPEGGYRALVKDFGKISDETDPEKILPGVKEAYEKKNNKMFYKAETMTDKNGKASFEVLPQGLYLVEESAPALNHAPSRPFLVSVPFTQDGEWVYSAFAEPKPVAVGSLLVKKTVRSRAAEDKKMTFHFILKLKGVKGPVPVIYADGTKGMYQSGMTFTLKDGEKVLFPMIPAGTVCSVREKEANRGGFLTSAQDADSVVKKGKRQEVFFLNRQLPPRTGDSYIGLIAAVLAAGSLGSALALLFSARRQKRKGGKE